MNDQPEWGGVGVASGTAFRGVESSRTGRCAIVAGGILGTLWPWVASAGEASSATGAADTLAQVLRLLVFVAAAYLVAHKFVDLIQKRLLVVTGLEYVLLGVLLGPQLFTEIRVFDDLSSLAPLIAFAAGWVGLLYGMELDLRTLLTLPDRSVRLAVTDVGVTVVGVTVVAGVAFSADIPGWPALAPREAWRAAGLLGAASAAASSSAVDLVSARYPGAARPLLALLRRTARLEDLLAIGLFGVLFCVFHEGTTRTVTPPVVSDWIVLTVGLGLSLGVIFAAFLGDEEGDEHQRFLALVGIIVFASGAAFFLNLSALLVNLLLGVVIVNTRHGKGVYATLVGTAPPVRLVLLVFAGALWSPVPALPAAALSIGLVAVRLVAKVVACWLASLGTSIRSDLFRGLLAQGDVAVAMAVSFRLVYDGPGVDLAYTAVLASAVVYELAAPRLLKGLLVAAGDLRQDTPLTPVAGG